MAWAWSSGHLRPRRASTGQLVSLSVHATCQEVPYFLFNRMLKDAKTCANFWRDRLALWLQSVSVSGDQDRIGGSAI